MHSFHRYLLKILKFSQRKKLDAIRQMLSRYVPQLYAFTAQGVKEAIVNEKLEKLVGVWEGHKYFDDGCYKVCLYLIVV